MKIKSSSILFALSILLFGNSLIAQTTLEEPTPYIEINGVGEMEIAPNEIYIQVTIKERTKGNKKLSIEEQEQQMLSKLESKGITSENITLNDAALGYIKVSLFKKDVRSSKEYRIKCSSAEELKTVFNVLDQCNIKNAYISKVSHSDIKNFEKEVRIKAIKDAKNKAEYMLAAIGNTLGKPLVIRQSGGDQITVRGSRSNETDFYVDGIRVQQNKYGDSDKSSIQYQKIKLQAYVYIKFEVK